MIEFRERRFRYTWSRTWPDKAKEYLARDGETSIGRVYQISSNLRAARSGSVRLAGNRSGADSGQVDNLDEACHAVEAAYDELMARIAQGEAAARSEP